MNIFKVKKASAQQLRNARLLSSIVTASNTSFLGQPLLSPPALGHQLILSVPPYFFILIHSIAPIAFSLTSVLYKMIFVSAPFALLTIVSPLSLSTLGVFFLPSPQCSLYDQSPFDSVQSFLKRNKQLYVLIKIGCFLFLFFFFE